MLANFISLLLFSLLPLSFSVRPEPKKPFSEPLSATPRPIFMPKHAPILKEIYHGPPEMVWNCKLERQPCELKNGINFIPFENDLKPEKDTIIVNLDKAAQIFDGRLPQTNPKILFKASRLWTKHYFPARYVNACLYLSYAMSGTHHKQMYIMQRDREDKCIYSSEHVGTQFYQPISIWNDVEIQLDLKHGNPRFVLDFEYDLPRGDDYRKMGFVDIRNFSIAYGNCEKNYGNECDFPHQITSA